MQSRNGWWVILFLLVQVSSWVYDLGLPLSLTLQVGGEGGGVKYRNSLTVNVLYASVYSHIWLYSALLGHPNWGSVLVYPFTKILTSYHWSGMLIKIPCHWLYSLLYIIYIIYYYIYGSMALWFSLFSGSVVLAYIINQYRRSKPKLGFIDLTAFATCLIQYTFLSLCRSFPLKNGQNTRILGSLPFSYDIEMTANG